MAELLSPTPVSRDEIVRAAHLTPCHDIGAVVNEELEKRGAEARVAVLPQGPLTIPYLA